MNTPTPAQALGEVLRLSEKATPGPWDSDTIDNEGEYGDGGPDSHSGFKSFAICGDRGHVIMDSLNSDAAMVEVEVDEDRAYAWDETARNNSAFIVAIVNFIRQHGQHFAGLEARLNDAQNAWCVQATELRERAEAAEARCSELEGGCQMLREEVEGLRAAFLAAKGERHE